MIFYATLASGPRLDEANHFYVRRDEAIKLARELAPLHTDVRVVKVDPRGHHQLCELLNIASGCLPMHVDTEVVWRSNGKKERKVETEDLLS